MRSNPERLAWIVLLSAFAIFCTLVVTIPLSIRWYIMNATNSRQAILEVIEGTILVHDRAGITPNKREIREGYIIQTDDTSRGLIILFDGSSITLFPQTKILLAQMRSPRFGLSPQPNRLLIQELSGRTRVRVAKPITTSLHFELKLPHATAYLEQGSFAVKAGQKQSEIAVSDGRAVVGGEGDLRWVSLEPGQRLISLANGRLEGPVPAARNLVANNNFIQPMGTRWEIYDDQGGDGGNIGGEAAVLSLGDRRAVRFNRGGGHGNHYEIGIRQQIDEDISDSTSLVLRLEVRIDFQSLSGGGYQSSEYPIIVRVNYKDAYKGENFWTRGFYYFDDGTSPTMNGERIPQHVWYPYESPNLLTVMNPKPFRIDSIRIYASGWDFESLVSSIELITE